MGPKTFYGFPRNQFSGYLFIPIGFGAFNPVDAGGYVFGAPSAGLPATSFLQRLMTSPVSGCIVELQFGFNSSNTPTTETSNLSIRINSVQYTLNNALALTPNIITGFTNFKIATSFALEANKDWFEFLFSSATWVTNPLSLVCSGFVIIKTIS